MTALRPSPTRATRVPMDPRVSAVAGSSSSSSTSAHHGSACERAAPPSVPPPPTAARGRCTGWSTGR
eukprot:10253605-Alexandrium_andersonii.AAC.1